MEKILNVHNFHSSKTGKDYSILTILRDLTEREKNQGYIGELMCEEVFLPDSLVNQFGISDVGKEIERQYSVVGGKAYLENILRKEK